MENRFHLFTLVHKGLRHALQRLVWSAGRLDIAQASERQQYFQEFKQIATMLHRHALDEDTHIQPLIEQCAPQIGKDLETQHLRSEELLNQLEKAVAEMEDAAALTEEVHRTWLSFVDTLNRFTGDYFLHLYHEECLAMPALWGAFDDAALIAAGNELRSGIPPHIQDIFQQYMIPALNTQERVTLLANVKQMAPEFIYQQMCRTFETHLEPEEWALLKVRLSVHVHA